jgi:hypothetical protein
MWDKIHTRRNFGWFRTFIIPRPYYDSSHWNYCITSIKHCAPRISSKMATIDEFVLKNIGLWWRYGISRHCDEWKYIIIGRIFESEITAEVLRERRGLPRGLPIVCLSRIISHSYIYHVRVSRTQPIYHKMLFMTCVFPACNQKTDGVPNTHIHFLRLLAQEPPIHISRKSLIFTLMVVAI